MADNRYRGSGGFFAQIKERNIDTPYQYYFEEQYVDVDAQTTKTSWKRLLGGERSVCSGNARYLLAEEINRNAHVPFGAVVWVHPGVIWEDANGLGHCEYRFNYSAPIFAKLTGEGRTSLSSKEGNGQYSWYEVYRTVGSNPRWLRLENGRSSEPAEAPDLNIKHAAVEINDHDAAIDSVVILYPTVPRQHSDPLDPYACREGDNFEWVFDASTSTTLRWAYAYDDSYEDDSAVSWVEAIEIDEPIGRRELTGEHIDVMLPKHGNLQTQIFTNNVFCFMADANGKFVCVTDFSNVVFWGQAYEASKDADGTHVHPWVPVKLWDPVAAKIINDTIHDVLLPKHNESQHDVALGDILAFAPTQDKRFVCVTDYSRPAAAWGKVQTGFTNDDGSVARTVSVKACDWDGDNVVGDAFDVKTPLRANKATALFDDYVVHYIVAPDGTYVIDSDCFDDALGTVKGWDSSAAIPDGWEELVAAQGRFLVGCEGGETWDDPGDTGGADLDNLSVHTHTAHPEASTSCIGGGSVLKLHMTLAGPPGALDHSAEDVSPPWYAVTWIKRTS